MERGILGGTFDPPHIAHLFAGEAAYRQLGLDIVHVIPAGAPWQKADRTVSDAEHRLAMVEAACADIDYLKADDREVNRDGWTYTADTLDSFDAADELTLIVGADAARGITTWHRSVDVLARARIAVMPRPGVDGTEVLDALDGANVVWLDTPEILLSGTMLRNRIGAGQSIRFLVTEAVHDYVLEHGLYSIDPVAG